MALHPDFPGSTHANLDPGFRWFPADEALRQSSMEKLMPPLVAYPRRRVTELRVGITWARRRRATRCKKRAWLNPPESGFSPSSWVS
jgi:type III restriction enzyme